MNNLVIPTAGVLLIKNNNVLLVKHVGATGHLNGTYGIPAGGVEKGETEIAAATRELEEETGLIVLPHNLQELPSIWSAIIERQEGGTRTFSLKVFVGNIFEGQLAKSIETIPEWVDINKLDKYRLLPNIKEIIEAGLQYAGTTRS